MSRCTAASCWFWRSLRGAAQAQVFSQDGESRQKIARPRGGGAASWLRFPPLIDARADTHENATDWSDRLLKCLGLAVGKGSAGRGSNSCAGEKTYKKNFLKKKNIYVDSEFLGVTAARFTAGLQADTLDLVAARFTPSRTPLLY